MIYSWLGKWDTDAFNHPPPAAAAAAADPEWLHWSSRGGFRVPICNLLVTILLHPATTPSYSIVKPACLPWKALNFSHVIIILIKH